MKKEQQSRALVRLERNGHSPALQLEGDVEGNFTGKRCHIKRRRKKILLDIAVLMQVILRINIEIYPKETIMNLYKNMI